MQHGGLHLALYLFLPALPFLTVSEARYAPVKLGHLDEIQCGIRESNRRVLAFSGLNVDGLT